MTQGLDAFPVEISGIRVLLLFNLSRFLSISLLSVWMFTFSGFVRIYPAATGTSRVPYTSVFFGSFVSRGPVSRVL